MVLFYSTFLLYFTTLLSTLQLLLYTFTLLLLLQPMPKQFKYTLEKRKQLIVDYTCLKLYCHATYYYKQDIEARKINSIGVSFGKDDVRNNSEQVTESSRHRLEIVACIRGLEIVAEEEQFHNRPFELVILYTSSDYVVSCMNKWSQKWVENGWRTTESKEVANRDLLEELMKLKEKRRMVFKYIAIDNAEYQTAVALCNI